MIPQYIQDHINKEAAKLPQDYQRFAKLSLEHGWKNPGSNATYVHKDGTAISSEWSRTIVDPQNTFWEVKIKLTTTTTSNVRIQK